MLAIKVEYLTGVCMATKHDDPDRAAPEWPPHPDRLYSALVAGAADLSAEQGSQRLDPEVGEGKVLHWLSEQGAPQLRAGHAYHRSSPDVHMPSNPHPTEVPNSLEPGPRARDPEKRRKELADGVRNLLPVHRKKAALPIPAVVPEEPVVYFIWPDVKADGQLDMLRRICDRVTYLGRSRSLVRVSVADDPPEPTYVPDPLGQIQLRVPGEDRLTYLVEKHERDGGKPEPCPPRRYRRVDDNPYRPGHLETVFDRMYMFKPAKDDPPLPAVSTLKLTQTLREALIRCIEDDQHERGLAPNVPAIVHGHDKHPHCAYVALPFVHPWQRHADGSLKGLAVVLPREVDEADLAELASGLQRLQNNGLGIPGIGNWRVEEVPADDPPMATLNIDTWTKPSRIWTTVTPMVFGHFPKPNNGGEAKVILDSLEMVGIDRNYVVEIAVGRHSPLHGAPPSWCFKTRRDKENGKQMGRWLRHVTLRFDRPVRGPLLLGCKRYFGLGLMRPLEE